jgi:hypothetical protein
MRLKLKTSHSLAVVAAMFLTSPATAQDPRRELGAHVHGQGTLDVAIEGNKMTLEFRAPGDDIVGFEGKAKTTKAKKAMASALATLEKPLALFVLPEAAQCSVVSAKAKVGGDHDHGHDHGTAKSAKAPAAKHDHAKSEHSEFHADYELTCAQPALATSIDFGYFKAFPKAEKVGVQIITAKGQTSAQATPAKTRVEFDALVK